jgi:hypothetical protein
VNRSLITLFLVFLSVFAFAQEPPLERRVDIAFQNATITQLLTEIEEQSHVVFSYQSTIFSPKTKITVNRRDIRIREVLLITLGNSYSFKQHGDYIIIKKEKEKSEVVIRGYVESANGEIIREATVYDKRSLASANTDEYGYYELRIETKEIPSTLYLSKLDYEDALIPLDTTTVLNESVIQASSDSIPYYHISSVSKIIKNQSMELSALFVRLRPEIQNINDTIYRDFQTSFVPFIGTNHKLSGNVSNKYSFNILGGYSCETRAFELAGLFNFVETNVRSVQIGGLFNYTGQNQSGLQIGGLFNHTRLNSNGIVIGGLFNYSDSLVKGIEIAGFSNIHPKGSNGFAIAGFANYSGGNSRGMALAGFANVYKSNFKGLQLSGFLNYAKTGGTQIGIVNIADSLTGVPIGIFNFIRKGYNNIEVSYDEQQFLNLELRSGVNALYSRLLVSSNMLQNDETEWSYGYGIGSAPALAKNLHLNIDLSAQHFLKSNHDPELDMLGKLGIGLEYRITPWISIFGMATANASYREINLDYTPYLTEQHYYETEMFDNGYQLNQWIGYKFGLRFF